MLHTADFKFKLFILVLKHDTLSQKYVINNYGMQVLSEYIIFRMIRVRFMTTYNGRSVDKADIIYSDVWWICIKPYNFK